LKASIAPSQSQWPTEHLHLQCLGEAAGELRSRLGKFLEAVDEIEADPRLSSDGNAEERKKAAEKALAAFAGSRTLARAQESAASIMEKWVGGQGHRSYQAGIRCPRGRHPRANPREARRHEGYERPNGVFGAARR
jgi:hypothetical protein